ncbi:MAG: Bug family tripartite tricarboxylate transporter substrate binding protein [Betaproteobacteria bacterium]|jgi:tripartite-type tricarboxylate transporter receptor subunit TctC
MLQTKKTTKSISGGLIKLVSGAFIAFGILVTTMFSTEVVAQVGAAANFPDKPVKLVVPFPAGGASDILARLVGKELSELWKQTVLIENKPGAAGHLGGQYVASSKPDGYTMLVADLSILTMTPSLMDKMTYNPAKELTSVAIIAYSPHILVVKNQMPVKTFDEFIAYAKAQKNPVSIGVTLGTSTHLAGVVLSKSLGFEYNFIGYKGGAQVVSDLAGGQIDSTLNSFLATYPMVKAGNFRLIAVASPKRFGPIPDTMTIAERSPDFVTGSFQGVVTAAGTPAEIVAKINADIMKVVAKPEVQKRFAELGSESVSYNPVQMQKWLVDQTAYWGKVIKDNNIKLQ